MQSFVDFFRHRKGFLVCDELQRHKKNCILVKSSVLELIPCIGHTGSLVCESIVAAMHIMWKRHEDKCGPLLNLSVFLKFCILSEVQLLSRMSGEWKQALWIDRPLLFQNMFEIKDNSIEGFFFFTPGTKSTWKQKSQRWFPKEWQSVKILSSYLLFHLY